MKLKHIKNISVKGRRVIVRVDLNFDPQTAQHYKLLQIIPTLNFLHQGGATIAIISHRGRPKRKESELSLKLFSELLSQKLQLPIHFIKNISQSKKPSHPITLLENLRFFPEEEINDLLFAKTLASWGDIYVNDAFASSHRAHASTAAITSLLPSYAGFLLHREIETINKFITRPKRPFLAIIGGKKTADKIPVLKKLIQVVDDIYLGGVVANTFLKAAGVSISSKSIDIQMIDEAKLILKKAKQLKVKIHLLQDAIIEGNPPKEIKIKNLNPKMRIVDIGPESQKELTKLINKSQTILWNGPMGKYEEPSYRKGTAHIIKLISKANKKDILIGGGDTLSLLDNNFFDKSHIHFSTGGGALLQYLADGQLPALIPLVNPT